MAELILPRSQSLSRWADYSYPAEGVGLDDFLLGEPGEEASQAPQVAVYAVAGEAALERRVMRVTGKAFFLL